jgi:glycosyltransferase involved in cell wall biosynthesis
MRLSVTVPTYRRIPTLLQALQSLQDQTAADFEILVADNAADAELEKKVAEFNQTARVKARYVPVPQLGLHHARHAGANAATGEILVFTDDDATFDPGWLQAYAEMYTAHPKMLAAGGPIRPVWETPPPQWLLDYIGEQKEFPILSLREPFTEFRLGSQEVFYGVNMSIRRDVLFALGGFNPELLGGKTIGDGESGLNRKLRERGDLIGYIPGALVHHHIPPQRMTVQYICKWAAHMGGSEMFDDWRKRKRSARALVAEALALIRTHWRDWLRAKFVRRRFDREAIDIQFRASLGWCKLKYVWWMQTDATVQAALDAGDKTL